MRTIVLSLAFTSAVVCAQTHSQSDLRFEVVSIKRNTSNALGSNGSSERPDGGFTLLNVPMMTLVARAQFPLIAPVDMIGLPEWARSERFDMSARSPLSRAATPQERAAMVRAMLVDRVKLATHVEKRQVPVYDLVLARADGRLGAGIKPSEVDCVAKAADRAAADGGTPPPRPAISDFSAAPPPCSGLRITDVVEGDVTMDDFARFLRASAGRPVVDKTGLKGSYRITVQYDRPFAGGGPDVAPSASTLPSLFSALPAQLGLKLDSSKAEQDVLVIDRLERPTGN